MVRYTAMMVLQIIIATPETAALGSVPLLKALSWTYVMMERAPAYASSQAGWICSSGSKWLNSPEGSLSNTNILTGKSRCIMFAWWLVYEVHVTEVQLTFVSQLKGVRERDADETSPVTAWAWVWIWKLKRSHVHSQWHQNVRLLRIRTSEWLVKVSADQKEQVSSVCLTEDLWRCSYSVAHSMYLLHLRRCCLTDWNLHSSQNSFIL